MLLTVSHSLNPIKIEFTLSTQFPWNQKFWPQIISFPCFSVKDVSTPVAVYFGQNDLMASATVSII